MPIAANVFSLHAHPRVAMKQLFEVTSHQLGSGPTLFAWSPNGQYLAVCGIKLRVVVLDRKGDVHDEISLSGREHLNTTAVMQFAWDRRSEKLAMILQTGGKQLIGDSVMVYTARRRESMRLEPPNFNRDATHAAWDPEGRVLSVATAKGNLLLYDSRFGKTTSVLGKHTKRVTCGAWSADGRLAMGADDKKVTVSAPAGDTELELALKAEPKELKFAPEPAAARGGLSAPRRRNQMSVNVGGRTLYLYRLGEAGDAGAASNAPTELAFSERYGRIERHHWFGDGYLLVGFETGQVVLLSTENDEQQEELSALRLFGENAGTMREMRYCPETRRAAVASGRSVKLVDVVDGRLEEVSAETLEFDANNATVTCLGWALEGQVLTVGTGDGHCYSFLASLPNLSGAHDSRLAYLTSLAEVSIADLATSEVRTIAIDSEPAFLALGEAHVAAGMNNQAWYYRVGPASEGMEYATQRVNQREYLGTVDEVALNDRLAAVRSEGHLFVHIIEHADDPTESQDFRLPEPDKEGRETITCVATTNDFLAYGTAQGTLRYYYLPDRVAVNEHRHDGGAIERLFLNATGTRAVFLDERSVPTFFNPVNDQALEIPEFQGPPQQVLWDAADPNIFVIANGTDYQVYTYASTTINGPIIEAVGTHPQAPGAHPIMMLHGVVAFQLPGGKMQNELLSTHAALRETHVSGERGRERFVRALNMNRLQDAWEVAAHAQIPEMWEQLAHRAMTHMEIEFAIRVYRFVGDASMVMSLERLEHIEDKNMLAGNILILFERDDCYDMAQELFVRSGRAREALQMRKDLKHWDEAMRLAKEADPSQLDDICREHAAVLEMRGEHDAALEMFSRAVQYSGQSETELERGRAGIARCAIRVGDARRGKRMALESPSVSLRRECAEILETINQPMDAAELYQKAGEFERAASIYVGAKAFHLAKPIMEKVSSPKLHLQYARAKESEGKLAEAAEAYELGRDFDSVVRLRLQHLNDPERAYSLVRTSRSTEAAALAARHCRSRGDVRRAIEFLLLSRDGAEAFTLARENDQVAHYADALGKDGTPEEYRRLAAYFESKGEHARAGDAHAASAHAAAVRSFLKIGGACVDRAIDVAGEARNDAVTAIVVEYLSGDADGVPKDHAYLFKLRVALREYDAAAPLSALVAKQEQEMGNYKMAHAQLFETHEELTAEGKRPPAELTRQLSLLHSYVLVKCLVRRKDHDGAARLLARVSRNISKFPAHVVPILTSTVIECVRAGMKRTALEFAQKLVGSPELRSQIAEPYRRKIESVVRKPDKSEAEEGTSACPHCGARGPETEMTCDACKADIPMCIASGKRVRLEEWATCPSCRWPCNASAFRLTVESEGGSCPMCNKAVNLAKLTVLEDPLGKRRAGADAEGGGEA